MVNDGNKATDKSPPLRRVTRSLTSSPTSPVRKSRRLENNRGSPLSVSNSTKVNNKGSKKGKSAKNEVVVEVEEEEDNTTLKEIVKEVRDSSSPKVCDNRKVKRLNARQFKEMYGLKMRDNNGVSETNSRKRKLDSCYDNVDSGSGGSLEVVLESCGKGVDNGNLKSEEGLDVECDESRDSGLGVSLEVVLKSVGDGVDSGALKPEEGLQMNCDEHGDSGGSRDERGRENYERHVDEGIEVPSEEPQECSSGEEIEGDCARNTNECLEKPCKMENEEGQLNLTSPLAPRIQDEKNSRSLVEELNGFVVKNLEHQDLCLGLDSVADDVNCSRSSREALPVELFVAGGEECARCSINQRSDRDSLKQEPCGCVSTLMGCSNSICVSKDRGECSNVRDENVRKTDDSAVVAIQKSIVACERAGNLLHCSGKACRRSHHVQTPEENAHVPVWYCSECMKKKLSLGVHSVSEGIESILDAREVELPNCEGSLKEKQYFVKYKCLAHIHNCWIAEPQLIQKAPELLTTFGDQRASWNPEWAVPHRLLSRRLVIVDSQDVEYTSKSHHEWLVKWRGLDYDQATWELEGSEFFKKPEFLQLLKEYETRHNCAKKSFTLGDDKVQETRKHGRVSDCYRAESVNKLRELHHKSQNAILLDEQDKTMKVVYFISSILSIVHRPFLIITPHESLSYWEAEFVRFMPSINVVSYSGKSDSRKMIRHLEFYGEGSELLLQVLLSSAEAISEDLEHIKGINWEAIIIDDIQVHCNLGNSDCIKTLPTNWKLLTLEAQLKDTFADYINILSLLEPVGSSNDGHRVPGALNKDIKALKERVCSFIISPRFQEYWIPVEISNVQLEQYCSFMLSNSTVLRSCSKTDPMDSLHDILLSMQKCCDHPYIVNPSLRISLLPEDPSQDAALDMGIKASGKLQLLDKLLSEFRNSSLKVVILFQSIGGSGKDNLEFLLDDLLTWRFGKDSFEHVAVGGQPSKKQAALNKFNTESDVSFLLLETRACLPSIKLSLVDSVIILNSDWNPLNDIRALQKIMIDSKLKPIKVFRLYCSCTIEEKALIITKNDTILDNTVPMNTSTKQMLLMWGSSYLFSRLDEFHHATVLNHRNSVSLESSFVTDVFQEIMSLLKDDGTIKPRKYISEARRDGRCYLKNTLLFGEQRNQLEEGIPSHTFWINLLEGKQPQWKYLSMSYERHRKRVDYSDDLSLPLDDQTDEPVKRRKVSSPQQAGDLSEKLKDKNKEHQGIPDTSLPAQDDRHGLYDQKGLFEMLKPSLLRLCEALVLKDEVKTLAERFLEYVLNNHRVTREPETILQAFQISVCWTAAEVLEENIDHRNSLDIVTEKMDFKCLEQEVDSVNRKMKMLMKIFLSRNIKILKSCIDPNSVTNDGRSVLNRSCGNMSVGSLKNIPLTNKEARSTMHMTDKEKDSFGDDEKVQNNRAKKIQILKERHNDEIIKFEKSWLEKRAELEANYNVESAVVRYTHSKSADVVEKLKILEIDYAKKRENLDSEIFNHRKELEARQKEEIDAEQMAQSLELSSVNTIQLPTAEHLEQGKDSDGFVSPIAKLPEEQISSEEASGTPCKGLDDGQHQVEGVEVQVHPLTENYSTSPGRELSSADPPNPVSTPLLHSEGTSVLPVTDNSLTVDLVHSRGFDQNRFASNSQINNQPNEAQIAVQNSFTQMQQQIPQLGVVHSIDVREGPIAHVSHPNPGAVLTPTISRVLTSYNSDPLQIEFDRIRKQIGEISYAHEETKLRLKSECDKEIEELVAQIRKKHYAKLEEAESSFSLKKKELEKNHNLVMMNKFLADAFRSKCMDYKAGSKERTQGMSSSSIDFPFELQPTTTPPSVTASVSIAPAARPNNTPPPVPIVSHHARPSSGGFHMGRHEIRDPFPQLRHTSVPPSTSSPNNNLTSSSSPQIPAKPPHQPPAFQSTHVQSHQPDTFSRESALSLSATELLMEMARRNNTYLRHLSNNLPPWPGNMQDHDTSDLSQAGRAVDVEQPNGDVVCLSDDD